MPWHQLPPIKLLSIFKRLHRMWMKHILFHSRVPYPLWKQVVDSKSILKRLDKREQHCLRKLTSLFLQEKTFSAANGFEVTTFMQVYIAAQACLLILKLDLDYFDGWHEIIIYPDAFITNNEVNDEAGVVHQQSRTLAGEAWGRGPVILSWSEAKPEQHSHGHASNVVLHEFAHKLDMLNGVANGMPTLHANMKREQWTESLAAAYKKFSKAILHHHTTIDPYAAENPAEFFAVLTEVFFEQPQVLKKLYPHVYHQYALFYRQDPVINYH